MADSQKIPAKRLTREQIREGLAAVPVDVVLLGAAGAKSTKLTAKQKAFAEGLAMGKTKAAAYRDAYDSKGKPQTASRRGQELAKHGAIAAQVEALTLAAEAQKYATPAALRALVIQQLTAHAISDEVKPAQRLKALELLGKVTEVAAFTERREIIKTTDAGSARAALLETLRQALRSSAIDAKIIETTPARVTGVTLSQGDELPGVQPAPQTDPGRVSEAAQPDPTTPTPPAQREAHAQPMLSNPHTESGSQSDISVATQISQSATRVTPVTVPGENPDVTDTRVTPVTLPSSNTDASQEGGGGEKNPWDEVGGVVETPPSGNWK
jgi:hypothetical protein